MAEATLALYLDNDDDATYGEASEDIISYVVRIVVRVGMFTAGQRVAEAPEMVLTVDNSGSKFYPEAAGALGLVPGRFMRLTATASAVTYNVFTGSLQVVRPIEGQPLAEIVARGRSWRREMPIDMALQTGASIEAVIEAAITAARWRLPTRATDGAYYIILDKVGKAELDTARLWPELADTTLETAVGSVEYFGDVYGGAPSLRTILDDLVRVEQGYFYEDGSGEIVFANRQHVALNHTSQTTLTDDEMIVTGYAYGEGIINHATARVLPRTVETAYVFYTSAETLTIGQGDTKLIIRFRDSANKPIGVFGNLGLSGWLFYDASGNDVTRYINISLLPRASGVEVIMRNEAGSDAILQAGAQVIGTAVLFSEPLDVESEHAESASLYGRRSEAVNLPLFAALADAKNLCDWLCNVRSVPIGRVRAVTLQNMSSAMLTQQLARAILDVVTITLTDAEVSEDYYIVGIEHVWQSGAPTHSTTFYLEPWEGSRVLILDEVGMAELDARILSY